MEGLGLLFLVGFAVYAVKEIRRQKSADFEDDEVSINDLRQGIQNKWYDVKLTVVDGTPAVFLSGKTKDGKDYEDVFAIKKDDWDTLQKEGTEVITYVA